MSLQGNRRRRWRRNRCVACGLLNKIKVPHPRGRFPGRLPVIGFLHDVSPHLAEQTGELQPGRFHISQKVLGVNAVSSRAIRRHIPRSGGVNQQTALGGFHLRQTLGGGSKTPVKGVVPAGVEKHHIHGIARTFHFS